MFHLHSEYRITPPQQEAVTSIAARFRRGMSRQVLLGVTGSGKTFTMANLIADLQVPTLILSPNKTLAAQLYQEFRAFFPRNRVGYFISYYDYYIPEAYVPERNLYIAKEVNINAELERLRIEALRHLLEDRATIIVASVSAIYSIGSPNDFAEQKHAYSARTRVSRSQFLADLVRLGYVRTEEMIGNGQFRVRGETVEVFPSTEEFPQRFVFAGEVLARLETFDAVTGREVQPLEFTAIFPVSYFHYRHEHLLQVAAQVREELTERASWFRAHGKREYAERLESRTQYDMERLEQFGHCPGIENYARYLTRRRPGEAPFTLLDFFPDDFLTIIDESHISIPQLNGMYEGDRSRKQKLVDFGFRLPSALDNRPLTFGEIDLRLKKTLYVSATPAPYELRTCTGAVTELLVRPTGLLDPPVEIRRRAEPVADMLVEIEREIAAGFRVLITTLTKKTSEKLADYLMRRGIRCSYLHSEIKALDRIKLLARFRRGDFSVLVGINLLREGLDLPEVSLVIITDADKEGFLRSETALMQTFGRAARNLNGRVLLYIERMNATLERAVAESERRRRLQMDFNQRHGITPTAIVKKVQDFACDDYWLAQEAQEPQAQDFRNREALEKEIERRTGRMKRLAAALDFTAAAAVRDEIQKLKNLLVNYY